MQSFYMYLSGLSSIFYTKRYFETCPDVVGACPTNQIIVWARSKYGTYIMRGTQYDHLRIYADITSKQKEEYAATDKTIIPTFLEKLLKYEQVVIITAREQDKFMDDTIEMCPEMKAMLVFRQAERYQNNNYPDDEPALRTYIFQKGNAK